MSANLPAEFQKFAGHKRYLKKLLRETRCTMEDILRSKYFNSSQLTQTLLSLPEEDLIHQVIDHPTGIVVLGERTSAKAIVVNELLGYPLLPVINDTHQPLARAPEGIKKSTPTTVNNTSQNGKSDEDEDVDPDGAKVVVPNGHVETLNGYKQSINNNTHHHTHNEDITTWRTCKFMYGHQPSVTLAVQNTYELVEHLAANDNHHRSSSIWQQIPASDLELKPQPATTSTVAATSSIGHAGGDNSSSSATTGSCCSGGPHHHPHVHQTNGTHPDIYFPNDYGNPEHPQDHIHVAFNGHNEAAHCEATLASKDDMVDPGYFQATLECKLPHDLLAHDVQLIIAPSLDDFNEIYNLCFDSVNPIVIYAISSDAPQLSQREMEHLRQLRRLAPKLPVFFVRTPSASLFQPCIDEDEYDEIDRNDLGRYNNVPNSSAKLIPGPGHCEGAVSAASSLQEITELTESQQHSIINGHHLHDPKPQIQAPPSQLLIPPRTSALPSDAHSPQSYNTQMMAAAAEKLTTLNKSLHGNQSPTTHMLNGHDNKSPLLTKRSKLERSPALNPQMNGVRSQTPSPHPQINQYEYYQRQRQRRQNDFMDAVECHNKMTIRPRRTMSCSSTTSSKINHDQAASSLIIYQQLTTLGFLNLDFSLRNIRQSLSHNGSSTRGSSSTKTSPSSNSTITSSSPVSPNGNQENEAELSEALISHRMQVEMFTDVNSEFVDNFENFASILLHVRHVLQASLVQVANVLNNLHTRCLRLFICSAFDMTWDLMITPKRIDYAKHREAELFDSLMSIANRKQEEIRDMIIDTIAVMREDIVKQAAIYEFRTPIVDPRNLTSREVQICIGEIQEMVLSMLNTAIAGKLIGSVDYLRDSYVGTLERCLQSLEKSCQEAGESLMASHSLKQILNAAYQVEVNIKTSSSFMRVLWEKMKQVLESLTWRSNPVTVNDVEWKSRVALDVLRSLSESRLARSVCHQLKERLKVSHEHFASSMRHLEALHTGRLERTEEQRIKVRKLHAPRVAKLSLEATSLVDLIMFGMPQLGREIGRGQYGVVYACDTWGSFSPCAIKSVVPPDEKHWNDLAMEFYYTRSLPEHERIAQIRGSVIDHSYGGGSSPAVLLIMERLTRDLYAAIKAGLDWLSRLQVALDVVQGIRFLHSQGLVHRDIKLKNVLLDKRNRAKITDLGFCKPEAMMSGSIVGTPIHMAPELFSGKYDGSVDVYAFGILFWYICAGHVRLPYIFEQCQSKDQLWNCVRRGARPERLPQFDDESWALMEESWAGDPAKRPLLGEVEPRLRAILEKYKNQEPPNGYKKNYMRHRPQLQSRGSRSSNNTTAHPHPHHPNHLPSSQHAHVAAGHAKGQHVGQHPHNHRMPITSQPAPHQHIHNHNHQTPQVAQVTSHH